MYNVHTMLTFSQKTLHPMVSSVSSWYTRVYMHLLFGLIWG